MAKNSIKTLYTSLSRGALFDSKTLEGLATRLRP
jgi:hypothetical protein